MYLSCYILYIVQISFYMFFIFTVLPILDITPLKFKLPEVTNPVLSRYSQNRNLARSKCAVHCICILRILYTIYFIDCWYMSVYMEYVYPNIILFSPDVHYLPTMMPTCFIHITHCIHISSLASISSVMCFYILVSSM